MTKLRVYEYAKQLNMSSKEIITILNRLNVEVNNHMSVMDQEMIGQVEKFFSDVKSRAAARMETQSGAPRESQGNRGQRNNAGEDATNERRDHDAVPSRPAVTTNPAVVTIETNGGVSVQAANSSAHASAETGARQYDASRSGGNAGSTEGNRSSERRQGSYTGGRDTRSGAGQSPAGRSDQRGQSNHRTDARPTSGQRPDGQRQDGQRPMGQRQNDDRSFASRGPRPGGGQVGGNRPQGTSGGGGDRRPGGGGGSARPGGTFGGGGNRPSGGYASQGRPQQGGRPAGGGGSFGGRPAAAGGGSFGSRPAAAGGGSFGSRPAAAGGSAGFGSRNQSSKGGFKKDNGRSTDRTGRVGSESDDRMGRGRSGKWGGDQRDVGRRGGSRSNQRRGGTATPVIEVPRKVTIQTPITVGELAREFRKEASEVIKKLMFLGVMVTINQEIEADAIVLLASEFNIEVDVKDPIDENAVDMLISERNEEALVERPPVVTIMGHVDHGKTTLLDAIRETKVTASEAGGITQHIGAYQVETNGKHITFLDTPGHAAFTSMRARGAQVTDVTVLVVAADDGVMPQTVEAIHHAKAANVPIIVAVNKMDKPGANPDRVKQELTEHGLVAEEWGGDTIFVPVSALQKEGLDQLLEMILLVSEVAELKADPTARPRGTVIEAKLDKGRGPVATVLVQDGLLKVGDIIVAGQTYGRVRAMYNDRGRRVKEAGPSEPAEILGMSEVPNAGDLFVIYDDERKARSLVEKRTAKHRAETLGTHSRVTLDDLHKQIQEGNVKELNVIIKGDVHGSVEAIVDAIGKIDIEGVRVRCLHSAVGAINESDATLAAASNAIIVGFNVRPDANTTRLAESEDVEIRLYRVIYDIINEIEGALRGMLDPVLKEVIVGRAEVRQTFKVSRIGTIAGCLVTEGKIVKSNDVRVIRDGIVVHEGKLDSLKRFKDDVREVATGYECGITFEKFHDLKDGDVVESYTMEAVKTES